MILRYCLHISVTMGMEAKRGRVWRKFHDGTSREKHQMQYTVGSNLGFDLNSRIEVQILSTATCCLLTKLQKSF